MDKCTCTMAQKTVGDGCRYCNPQYAIDMLIEQDKDNIRASDEVIRGLVEALEIFVDADFDMDPFADEELAEATVKGREALAQARRHLGEK